MIVLCPKCKTKYRVDENKMGPEGVKLRCAKCQVIFKVAKRPSAVAPAPVAVPPPSAPMPSPPAPVAPPSPPPAPKAQAPAAPPPVEAKAPEPGITGPIMPKGEIKAEILFADADETFLNKVGDELVEAGYLVWYARDGESAWNFIKQKKPKVAIVEVMLPGLFGFEICEKVKADPELSQLVKLVLIGSVFEKNRFRRAPTTLYGADVYVDKYHNGKEVLKKVDLVLGFAPKEAPTEEPVAPPEFPPAPSVIPTPPKPVPPPVEAKPPEVPRVQPPSPPTPQPKPAPVPSVPKAPAPPPPPAPKPVAPPVEVKPTPPIPPPEKVIPISKPAPPPPPAPPPAPKRPEAVVLDWTKTVPEDPAHQKAARLARTIAADIALYNPELVERGVREGNFYQLLAKDIEDGRKHYESKVGPEITAVSDYFSLALEDLIAKKRKKLGLD